MPDPKIGDLIFHLHHEELVERLTEPLISRIRYIKKSKPKNEQSTRLRLMRAVKGPLPLRLERARVAYAKALVANDKAHVVYNKANVAYKKVCVAYDKAYIAYNRAITGHMPTLRRLHAQQCPDCPWDGHTIFPSKRAI